MLAGWYPLISNMNNCGVGDADLTVSTSPTFGTGLLGGSLISGGGSSWTATQTASILNNTAMSFCFWVYPDAATGDTGARARFFGNDSPRHYSIFQYPTCNDLHWDWRNNAGSTVLGGVLSGVLPSYKWTHVTFTYQNPTFKIYINGVLKHTASASLDVQSYANATSVILACSGRKLCDYRVYTHCLSALEVKQISQALVLHYPMTGGGRSGTNLVADSYVNTTSSNYGFGVRSVDITEGKTYTVSVRGYISSAAVTSGTKLAVYFYKSDWSYAPAILSITDTSPTTKFATFTATQTTTLRITSYSFKSQGTAGDPVTAIWYKVEEGDKATPWMPNSTDTEYTTMGYNDTTEYDVSGYLHNGTINGSVSYSSDTPRYGVSTHFTASGSQHIVIPSMTLDMTKFSVAVWFKADTAQIWSRILDMGEKTGGAGYALLLALGQNGTTFTVAGRGPSGATFPDTTIQSINLGQWYHVVVTIDTKTCKAYINGSLVKTFTLNNAFSTATPMALNYIGKSNWAADKYYDGNISDFRIYATCLDQEDIQKLYNTSASLANNGTLMAYEFTEV